MSRGLLFDLDGTLVDTAIGIAAALNAIRRERGVEAIDVADVRPLVSLGAQALIAVGLGVAARNPAADLATFRAILAEAPSPPDAIYPGVVAALDLLAAQCRGMAIVTNKPERLARVLLERLALAGRFRAIVGGDSVEACKPSPMPVRHALAALGTQDAIFVGDSAIDAAAARAAGLPFVLFTGGYGAADCADQGVAARFDHFADLPPLLAA